MSDSKFLAKLAEDEAIHWLARLNSPQLSDADERAFMEWLNASALHQAAYIKAEALWNRGAVLAQVKEQAKKTQQSSGRFGFQSNRWQGWAVAGCALVIVVLGLTLKLEKTIEHHYETALGEQQDVLLEDGSHILLNTNSKLDMRLDGKTRHAHLIQGEVFFDVKKDGRAFEVATHEGDILVMGTHFSVYQTPTDTWVTVSEGKVALGETESSHFIPHAVLQANERLSLLAAKAGQAPEKINSNAALAWRKKQLVFKGQTLNQVIAELSRYYPETIQLQDPELGTREITAVIQMSDIQNTLTSLSQTLGFRVEHNPDGQGFILRKQVN